MDLYLGVERARIFLLILLILVIVRLFVALNLAIFLIHFIWFLCFIVLDSVLISTHPKNHFICILVFSAGVMNWTVEIASWRYDSLLRPLLRLDSFITAVTLMLIAWNNSYWNILVGMLLLGPLLLLSFPSLLLTLHYDKLVSRNTLAYQIKMQPNQVYQQNGKHPNQKRVNPHSYHRPQICFPFTFRPKQNHPNYIHRKI